MCLPKARKCISNFTLGCLTKPLLARSSGDLFLLGLEAALPLGMIAKIDGCETVEFSGLMEISFHEPGLGQVIVYPSVGRMKIDRSLECPDGFIRFSLLQKEASLLHELQRGHAARIGRCLDFKLFLFLR
jgi:hypothetical protein